MVGRLGLATVSSRLLTHRLTSTGALLSSRLSPAWCRAGRPHGFGGFTPPSKLPFNTLHNVILAPNDCARRAADGARGGAVPAPYALPSLYGAQACFRMVERAEARARRRYDWVVRARPDLAWLAQYPEEMPHAFPPGTVLEAQRRRTEGGVVLCECRPTLREPAAPRAVAAGVAVESDVVRLRLPRGRLRLPLRRNAHPRHAPLLTRAP